MGKKLAIKGHATRGKEVIELLEMMGIVAIIPMAWSVCFGSLICGCDKMD